MAGEPTIIPKGLGDKPDFSRFAGDPGLSDPPASEMRGIEIATILAVGIRRIGRGQSPQPPSSTAVNLGNSSKSSEKSLDVSGKPWLHGHRG
jgi:hypothetical protein